MFMYFHTSVGNVDAQVQLQKNARKFSYQH